MEKRVEEQSKETTVAAQSKVEKSKVVINSLKEKSGEEQSRAEQSSSQGLSVIMAGHRQPIRGDITLR